MTGPTAELCAAFACSPQTEGGVSWTGGSAECVAAEHYWEERDQYTTRAAPNLSPHCTCSSTNECQLDLNHPRSLGMLQLLLTSFLGSVSTQKQGDFKEKRLVGSCQTTHLTWLSVSCLII